ncbi:50S ribosomal protein L10, partial [Sphaerochaeta sp. S2]|uniref:50S ribosomal protein L10 n=1 Tax=Sphaerochaeta sp. S2 TaxID=2798868 RepID=UPI00272D64E9
EVDRLSKNFENKKVKVEEIREKFSTAKSAILVDYRGLTVSEATELRNKFREAGVEYKVYKNNLMKLAIKESTFEGLTADLAGPSAVAFGYEDPVTPAKIIKDFAKEHKNLELKAGVVEGEYYDNVKIVEIADIPSREVLLSRLVGSFQAPVSNFAYLIKNIVDKRVEDGEENVQPVEAAAEVAEEKVEETVEAPAEAEAPAEEA